MLLQDLLSAQASKKTFNAVHVFLQLEVFCSRSSGAHWRLFGSSCRVHMLLSSSCHQCGSCSPSSRSTWGDCFAVTSSILVLYSFAFHDTETYFHFTGTKRYQTTAVRGPQQNRKGTSSFWMQWDAFFFYLVLQQTDTCSALQLFIILLEVEEKDRMKTTVLPEAEEKRLMEETQRKVEQIYSQLQHHDPQWVINTPPLCKYSLFLAFSIEPFYSS